MSNITIKIANPNGTYLKVTNLQSTDVSNEDKIYVALNTEIELTDITKADEKNHYRVSLLQPELGKYTYYLYSPHVVITKSNDPDYVINTPKSIVVTNSLNQAKVDLVNSQYSPFVQKQINSLVRSAKGRAVNLDIKVKYESQLDNYQMRYRSCNSSAHAMYLNYLLEATSQNKYVTDNTYLKQVLQIADTTVHWAHTSLLQKYGFNTRWDTDADIDEIILTLEAGIPVTCNINHHPVDWVNQQVYGGHIIVLIGYNAQTKMFITHDPFGDINTGYKNRNGAYNKMSKAQFKIRTQGGARFLI